MREKPICSWLRRRWDRRTSTHRGDSLQTGKTKQDEERPRSGPAETAARRQAAAAAKPLTMAAAERGVYL